MNLKKKSMKLVCLPIAASLLLTACNKENSIQPVAQNKAQRLTSATIINDFTVYFDSNVPEDKKALITSDVKKLYLKMLTKSILKSFAKNPIYVTNGSTGSIAFKASTPSRVYISSFAGYEAEKDWGWALPLLRELTKGYHAQQLGLDYAPVLKLYNEAKLKKAKTTINVKNAQEYLGEAVEVFFMDYGREIINQQDPNLYNFIIEHFAVH